MKKLTFSLMLLMASVFSFAQTAEDLERDENFVEYVTSFHRLAEIVGEKTGWESTRLAEIDKSIEEAKKRELTVEEQYAFINETIGLTDEDSFAVYHQRITSAYSAVQNKFPEVSKEEFSKGAQNVLARGCGWRYGFCAGAVAFEGGLLLAACEAASAGVATPLCLAGAVIYATNGIAECRDKYCD